MTQDEIRSLIAPLLERHDLKATYIGATERGKVELVAKNGEPSRRAALLFTDGGGLFLEVEDKGSRYIYREFAYDDIEATEVLDRLLALARLFFVEGGTVSSQRYLFRTVETLVLICGRDQYVFKSFSP